MKPGEKWKITWGDIEFTEDDMTGGDVAGVQLLLQGDGWAQCDPTAGPLQLMATICAVGCRLTGRPVEKIRAQLNDAKAADLYGALSVIKSADPQAA